MAGIYRLWQTSFGGINDGSIKGRPWTAFAGLNIKCSTGRSCDRRHYFKPNARLRTPEIRSLRGIGGSNQIGLPIKDQIPHIC